MGGAATAGLPETRSVWVLGPAWRRERQGECPDLPLEEEGPCRASSLLRSWAESLGRHLQRQSSPLLFLLRIKNIRPVENTEAIRLLWVWTLSPEVPAWVRSLQGALPHASDPLLFCSAFVCQQNQLFLRKGPGRFQHCAASGMAQQA